MPRSSAAVTDDWLVRVPASSANLGAAFDAMAVALAFFLEVTPNGREPADETHPAVRAFRSAGGVGPISVRSPIPGGRGLGFSGAARIGGLLAARAQRREDVGRSRPAVLDAATELEGHADNVAASLHGGVVAVAARHVVRVPLARELAVVVWIPDTQTATAAARRLLPEQVSLRDAAFNIGRTALLVAALAAGDVDALRAATEDRIHQDRRLARSPATRLAIEAALDAGAYAAWLSGSGPSAAAFADPARADAVARMLPAAGRSEVFAIATEGAAVTRKDD